jgi:hypothetical protein
MKDKLKTGGDVIKGMVKTGGDVADRVLDKSSDVASEMMKRSSGLISKLSDDIGIMANRILTMEERIGFMADRIVKTEELMAKLTAALADKEFEIPGAKPDEAPHLKTPVLHLAVADASVLHTPELRISGDPKNYIIYVSTTPFFPEGNTIASEVNNAEDLKKAWKRSISALRDLTQPEQAELSHRPLVVCVAVRQIAEGQQLSALSNSVDVEIAE